MKCIFCKQYKREYDLWYIDHKLNYGICSEEDCMDDLKYLQEHYNKTCRPRQYKTKDSFSGVQEKEPCIPGEVEDYSDYMIRILEFGIQQVLSI